MTFKINNNVHLINVALGERSYPIFIGSSILSGIGNTLKDFTDSKKIAIVTNPAVAKLYLEPVRKGLEDEGFRVSVIEVPDGEEFRSLEWAGRIYDNLIDLNMDRRSPLIALGGGVVGDITGFAAATYLRGVPYVQVPTTLLAQVDSSVGGKTAVNHRKGKNLIGAFYQPRFVYIDVATLATLDKRELKAGLAEVIKYGVIKDKALFEYLEVNINRITSDIGCEDALIHIIKGSCLIKSEVVEKDERESGYRAILNFGHTFGHAVEAATDYRAYKHGEAVAIGMIFAARLSHKIGLCGENVVTRISNLVKKAALPAEPPVLKTDALLRAMKVDKKTIGEELTFILPEEIGKVQFIRLKEADYETLLHEIQGG